MAKKAARPGDKPLVIVESPTKAKTIGKFLGPGYMIEASIGHIRDLPSGTKEIPAEYKGEEWAYLGVNVNRDFDPVYIVPAKKKEQIAKLKALMKNASELYLATDEDREGEAISWHLHEVLQPKVPVHRLVFHEITPQAIQDALASPRSIDDALVRAQETRRIVDRLYGYDVSPLLWRKFGKPGLSAGRVQSVAVRLVVQREKERIAFRSATYWDLLGSFAKANGQGLQAPLISDQGRKVPNAGDFDPATGQLKDPKLLFLDETAAFAMAKRLLPQTFKVASVEERPETWKPYAPFTTSTLQQEASRKWRMGAKQTMRIAQNLYENGLITYMRTDSTNLATVAIDAARRLIREQYGNEYLPSAPRFYSSKVKNAQEAHEAIRPAGAMELPENLRGRLEDDQFKLYDLIWKRTIACQMENARVRRTTVVLEADGARFQTSGKTIDFPGYLRAYVEGTDDPDAELADKEKVLPPLVVGEQLSCKAMDPKSHTTQPPPRYTEATLTRDLEGRGIGRPSTYASILDTILSRDYVFKKGQALVPTWTAFGVVNLLEKYLPSIVDYEFTARMEDDLDAISRGEAAHIAYLKNFYFGNDNSGLKPQIELQREGIDPRVVSGITIGTPEGGEEIQVRIGKFGPYLKQGERSASVPPDLAPDELDVTKALAILYAAKQGDEPLGYDPESGKPIYMKAGRFGPYVQMGDTGGDEKPKNSSLLKGMKPEDVDLDTALRLLSLPRTLGTFPATGEPVEAANGKFGPYVRSGKEYRSLPADLSPIDVTYDQAMALLSQPKVNRRGAASAPREPMRAFPESPVTGSPIQLFEGRYGPYVTDGETNASLPKDANPADLTFAEALNLLAARAAAGGGKKKKKAAKKKAPAASDAPKTAAKKKAAPKKKAAAKKAPASRQAAPAAGGADDGEAPF